MCDAPPVLVVADALVLATIMDGVLLVLDAQRTRRAAAQRTLAHLRQVGGRVLGAVLNHRHDAEVCDQPVYAETPAPAARPFVFPRRWRAWLTN